MSDALPTDRRALRRAALRFVGLGLAGSALMVALKIGVGVYSGSHALMVNAIYSLNDVLASLAVAVCLPITYRHPDAKHPFGYSKAELIAVGFVSITVVMFVCFIVVFSAIEIYRKTAGSPHYTAAPLAAASMVTTWLLARRARRLAQGLSSPALENCAEHYHSDATASLAALFGIGGAMIGFYALDPIMAIFEELQLMLIAGTFIGRAAKGLMDAGIPRDDRELVESACQQVRGVRKVVAVRSRRAGSQTWVDVAVQVGGRLTVTQAQEIAQRVRGAVRDTLGPGVVAQVQCQGPRFVFEAPGPGGGIHA